MNALVLHDWTVQNSQYFFKGLSSFLFVLGVGLFCIKSARSHAWLFQFSGARKSFHNWVEFLVPQMRHVPMKKYRDFLRLSLGRSGSKNRSVEHFMASQVVLAVALFLSSYLFFSYIWGMHPLIPIFCGVLGLVLPPVLLNDQANKRLRRVHRDLPFFLDYLSLSLIAGMDFTGALRATVENVAPSPLREEFSRIQSNMMLGMSREDALLEFEDRINSETVRGLVQTLVSSLKLGTDLSNTLQTLSSSLSTKRFQLAEEEAGKISVRMMVPMICFILPVVLLIMIGPMFLSFIQSGM
jgi:tight adherence protein C